MPFLQTIGAGSKQGFFSGLVFGEQIATFNYTGSVQTFTVPANTQSIFAYVFGPGGASDNSYGSRGGAGGFSQGNINPVEGATMKIIVGGAGGEGSQENGSGGGYSAVATPNWAGSNPGTDHAAIIIAAGGGGGTGDGGVAGINAVKAGAGGGASGQRGVPTPSSGQGGSQSGGGSYYGGGSGTGSCTAASCAGVTLRGGTGCGGAEGSQGVGWPNQIYGGTWGSAAGGNGCNAGGGGAGYYGGAGGGGGDPNGGSAGGGSGYTGGSSSGGAFSTSNVGTWTGNYSDPPSQATSNAYYSSGISMGGLQNANNGGNGVYWGGHGKVVLVYVAPL